jgi:hypothetical protein
VLGLGSRARARAAPGSDKSNEIKAISELLDALALEKAMSQRQLKVGTAGEA